MTTWFLVWLALSAVEGVSLLSINRFICDYKLVRGLLWPVVFLASVASIVPLLIENWQLFGILGFLQAYRLVNIARIMRWRLQRRRLQNASFSAFIWVFLMQCAATIVIHLLLRHISMTSFMIGLLVASSAVLLVILKTTFQTWSYTRPKELDEYLSSSQLPSLSVLIPARNETDMLHACLESLVSSDYPKLEIIVLDDCSVTKRTPEIIKSFAHDGVRFVAGKEPDSRWLPKNWAYEKLRTEASGKLLLYCGVDTRFTPVSLRSMVSTFVEKDRKMMSLMPQRIIEDTARFSILQPMRYFWELCLPRRLFKRPPVLSTCWMVSRDFLHDLGGFKAVSSSVTPEAYFARQAVTSDSYYFLRSNRFLPLFSAKPHEAQYQTTLRVRYPQLHRRIELVALTALFELAVFLAPFWFIIHSIITAEFFVLLFAALASALVTGIYLIVSVKTGLCKPIYGIASAPVAFVLDVIVLHVSCLLYEFGTVTWKGRNVCLPVMQVISRLPSLDDVRDDLPVTQGVQR
ncbi:MAG: hypothetical protein QG629_740 [Patescibacteria group bacterium]|nr:glycosyltransferase family 2 protein [Candidatus Saccharibacteria bacterium]MDQ5963657.1 hypothetical protein [Patescibacteria group bacterium]